MLFFPPLRILECGASHVALGTFAKSNNAPRLANLERATFSPDGDHDEWLRQITASLAALRERGADPGPIALVLPGHLTLAKTIRTPRVEEAKRAQLIRFEAEHWFPLPLAELCWDYTVITEHERGLEVLLCAARRAQLEALCDVVHAAGFTPVAAFPTALATLAAFRLEAGNTASAAIIDAGARSTNLLFADAERFHLRTMALGSRDVAAQFSDGPVTGRAQPDMSKRASSPDALQELATEWFASRIAHEFARTLANLERDGTPYQPQQILITGGATHMPGFDQQLSKRTKLPVALLGGAGFNRQKCAMPPDGSATTHREDIHALIGAAVIASNRKPSAHAVVDLLPTAWRARRAAEKQWRPASLAAVTAALAIAPFAIKAQSELRATTLSTEALQRQIAPMRAADHDRRAQLADLADVKRRLAELEATRSHRDAWPRFLAELENRFAEARYACIEDFQELPRGDTAPSAPPRQFSCTGRISPAGPDAAMRAAALIASIADSPFVVGLTNERFGEIGSDGLTFSFLLTVGDALR